MFSLNSLVVGIVLTLFPYDNIEISTSSDLGRCDDFNVEIKIRSTSNGLNNGQIEFEVSGTSDELSYFIFGPDEKLLSKNNKLVQNLTKGKYKYFVLDKRGCSKESEFEIN